MGTYYSNSCNTKQDMINEIIKDYSTCKVIDKSCIGNHLWILVQHPDGNTFIDFCLLSSGKKHGIGWGYKPMNEEMHPYYYSCPLKFLSKAPVLNQKWRDGVIKYHETRKGKGIELGKEYPLSGSWKIGGTLCTSITLICKKPLMAILNKNINTKIPRKMLAYVIK